MTTNMKKQGLYNPDNEHDSCGIGFVANLKNVAELISLDNRAIDKNRDACRFCPYENTQHCTQYG